MESLETGVMLKTSKKSQFGNKQNLILTSRSVYSAHGFTHCTFTGTRRRYSHANWTELACVEKGALILRLHRPRRRAAVHRRRHTVSDAHRNVVDTKGTLLWRLLVDAHQWPARSYLARIPRHNAIVVGHGHTTATNAENMIKWVTNREGTAGRWLPSSQARPMLFLFRVAASAASMARLSF